MSGYVEDLGGSDQATVVGTGQRTSAASAAFANGTFGHSLEFEDRPNPYPLGHASAVLLSSLLALGEKIGASGKEIIEAYVIGAEVGSALGVGYRESGFQRMSVFCRIAAAVGCAKMLRLEPDQIRMALGIVGSMLGGVMGNQGTMTKPLHAGLAARDGVIAAEMASRGWSAQDRTLEHPAGFMATFCGDSVNVGALVENLGKPFHIQDRIGFRRYPTGGASHRIIDALLDLMKEHEFDYQDVEELELPQPYDSQYMIIREPRVGLEGKFSVVYNAAAALVQGGIDIETFSDERVKDPRIRETMAKIRVRVMTQWEVGLEKADGRWRGHSSGHTNKGVQIRLKNGKVISENVMPDQVLGEPNNPWGVENVRDKFVSNASLALSQAQVAEATKVWWSLQDIKDCREAVRCVVAS